MSQIMQHESDIKINKNGLVLSTENLKKVQKEFELDSGMVQTCSQEQVHNENMIQPSNQSDANVRVAVPLILIPLTSEHEQLELMCRSLS